MASTRTVSTGVLVALSMAVGLFAGALLDREWRRTTERAERRRWAEQRREAAMRYDSRPEAERRRADSLALERAQREPGVAFPREVRRLQAMQHCVVTLAFMEGGTDLELLHVTARWEDGVGLRTGWAYRDAGYAQGTAVDVVIPEIECGRIRTLSVGAGRISLPGPPPLPPYIPPTPEEAAEPVSAPARRT